MYGAALVIFDSSAILNSIIQARIQWMKSNIVAIKEKEYATRATIGTNDKERRGTFEDVHCVAALDERKFSFG